MNPIIKSGDDTSPIINRKNRRAFMFNYRHHNIYTKKYSTARAYEKARIFFFGVDKKKKATSTVAAEA